MDIWHSILRAGDNLERVYFDLFWTESPPTALHCFTNKNSNFSQIDLILTENVYFNDLFQKIFFFNLFFYFSDYGMRPSSDQN